MTRRCQFQTSVVGRYCAVLLVLLVSNVSSAESVELPERGRFHLFLLAGQSNMAGRGEVTPQDRVAHPRVLMLDQKSQWVPAVDPLHFDKPAAVGVGLGRTFAMQVAESDPEITIGLVPCAVGGSPIASWQPGGHHAQTDSHPYDDAMRRMRAALRHGVLKGILWHQGESDAKPELAPRYAEKLRRLIGQLRTDLSAPDVPFMIGQMGKFSSRPWDAARFQVDIAHRDLTADVPHTVFVTSEGLDDKGDGSHFDSPSYRELGRRFADAYLAMTNGVTVNRDSATYDSHAEAIVAPNGKRWVAWHAYRAGKDYILARQFGSDGLRAPVTELTATGGIYSPPRIAFDEDRVCVVWSTWTGDRWQLGCRRYDGARWHEFEQLSDQATNAIHPSVVGLAGGRFAVAWTEYRDGTVRIRYRLGRDAVWGLPHDVSSGERDAHRPTLCARSNGELWIVWDEYCKGHYAVRARQIGSGNIAEGEKQRNHGAIEMVANDQGDSLNATAIDTPDGLAVAWLHKTDVIGGPRVISQWHTLRMALRRDGEWRLVRDRAGSPEAAELTQGLMAKISPQPVATGGYLGRRTAPILANVDGIAWLLWERKSDHQGSTWRVDGDLLGRPCANGNWGSPVTLDHGMIDYRIVQRGDDSTRLPLLASELPRNDQRVYHLLSCNVHDAQPYQQDEWHGWQPVALPVATELTPRKSVTVGDKEYQLFWADMHCHSGLTADAEGEPDELFHYARDRARLDIVVFTNNDYIYDVPLTQYEYTMSNFLAAIACRTDFLALPGFEWTSRIPNAWHASRADRYMWTPPYLGRSQANHRSVIYPATGGPLLHYPEVANSIDRLNDAVAAAGGVTLTQHESFATTGHRVEVGMELTSGWRRYVARRPQLFHSALATGARLGFVAAGDTHRRAPGLSGALTGIYAESLTSESVLEALRARRCFATSGSRIAIDSRANGAFMGRHIDVESGHVELQVDVSAPRPIERVVLVRNGTEIEIVDGDGTNRLATSCHDSQLASGVHWYYWRVELAEPTPDLPGNLNPAFGHLGWSTPHWVSVQ